MSLCARVDVLIELSNGPVTRYTKPAALKASAAHKCCIKCKEIVGASAVHKCCAHARTYTACLFARIIFLSFMYCLPFCAHYHETRTRRTSHVCAHRTLQRVPLNTRYTFKQSSMFNGVGINCSYVAMCTCRCVFIELSNGPVKRDIRSLLHWKQVLRTNAASSAKQLSAQVLCTSAALTREHVLPAFLRTVSYYAVGTRFSGTLLRAAATTLPFEWRRERRVRRIHAFLRARLPARPGAEVTRHR